MYCSGHDTPEAPSVYLRGFGDDQSVSHFCCGLAIEFGSLMLIDMGYDCSGSSFLKHWMEFLEENADLRYPDAGDLLG
jgi:hypothetical protein